MDASGVVILLSPRSGAAAPLHGALRAHPQVFCTPEVFDEDPGDGLASRTGFFAFREAHPLGWSGRPPAPAAREALLLDFLEFLRCFSDRPCVVVDTRDDSTHHLDEGRRDAAAPPALLRLAADHGVRVLAVRERNPLRRLLGDGSAGPVRVEVDGLLRGLERHRAGELRIAQALADCGHHLAVDAEDLLGAAGARRPGRALRAVADWLGIAPPLRAPAPPGPAPVPLRELIANHDEVARALRGTPFERCLDDERARHRRRTAGQVSTARALASPGSGDGAGRARRRRSSSQPL